MSRNVFAALALVLIGLSCSEKKREIGGQGDGPIEKSQRREERTRHTDDPPRVVDQSVSTNAVGPAFTTMYVGATGCSKTAIGTPDPNCGALCYESRCARVCVSGIPVGSQISAVNAYARESNGNWVRSWPRANTSFYDVLPYSRWYPEATSTTNQNKMQVCWKFANWSHDHGREAKLEVVFTPPSTAAPAASASAGQMIDDAAITAAVKAKLLADPAVAGMKIDVDTRNGVVYLTGSLSSRAEIKQAVLLARETSGVKRVENRLVVKGKE